MAGELGVVDLVVHSTALFRDRIVGRMILFVLTRTCLIMIMQELRVRDLLVSLAIIDINGNS